MAEPQPRQPQLFDYKQVKKMLESSIAFVEKKVNVSLEDDFIVEASIRVAKKNRNRPRKRLLISEQDTSQENLTDETTTFHFRTSFEETTSVSLATTQGLTASLGGTLGGGGMGGTIGLNSGLQYSQSKSFGQDKSSAATKELSADVEVKPNTLVIVKELVYEVEWAAMCELELILRKEDKIKYKYGHTKEKIRFIGVNKLFKQAKRQRAHHLQRPIIKPPSPIDPFFFRSLPARRCSRSPDLDAISVATSQEPKEDNSSRTISPPAEIDHQEGSEYQNTTPTPEVNQEASPTSPRKTDKELKKSNDATSEVQTEDNSPSPDWDLQEDLDELRHRQTTPLPSTESPKFKGKVMSLALYHHVILTENTIIVKFFGDCLFNGEEHKLEIIKLPSDPTRVKKIIDHQTGVSNQNNKEDMMLSLMYAKHGN